MFLSQENINFIRQYFATKPVCKAYLFGSFARGEADDKSDVDLLLELDLNKKIGWDFFDFKIDLENKLSRKVDLITLDGLSPLISSKIHHDKKLIYEK